MSDMLKHIYNACEPDTPATEEYYLDCGDARGHSALIREFERRLNLVSDRYLCFLFSGHIGCGKSSELEALRRSLSRPDATGGRYLPILINVSDYLDDFDVTLTDILLAIVAELAHTLRSELGIEIKDNYFSKRFIEIKDILFSDVEVKEAEIPLGNAKAKIQLLKRDPGNRTKVRAALEPHMTTMLSEINLIFAEARLNVKQKHVPRGDQPYKDIVVILDNLEKIRKFDGMADALDSQRELFLERYTQLTGMNTHIIYTLPLRLARSAYAPQLAQRYAEPFVLPMVKMSARGSNGTRYEPGWAFFRSILEKRFGTNPVDDVFTPGALEFLLRYSGGHMRNLMMFVQNACAYATSVPITVEAAHQSIQQTVRLYSTSIPDAHWSKLKKLDMSPDQTIPGGDEDYLVMLENLSVLEYINGGDDGDPFAHAEPWYAVNPIVRELQRFKSANADESVTG